jgi:Domain of unknown function (DUF1844)
MNEEETSRPKIIVDDDWKTQAQAEKAQLQQQAEAKTEPEEPDGVTAPPASFEVLISSLATQALSAMGQIPGPDGQPMVHLDYAKHFIDMIGVVEEKTKGNLTPEESAVLTNVVHELRMLYVSVSKQPTDETAQPSEHTEHG